ncbi:pyruvate kinase, partial [Klebsiella quasipneumoniae]|uniref:pyruvate kinase n=1 Tax=Klebsiella quasipneumoniae TaxID=1463165 RepID=UPI002F96C281
MKDQITHLPDNADRSVAKQKFKITNWPTYNKALINRGSITFWLDDEAIQAWYESATPSSRGRPQRYSDLAITTVLVDDGLIGMEVTAIEGNKVICKVLNNGDLGENKGVNLPGVSIALPALAEKDKQD